MSGRRIILATLLQLCSEYTVSVIEVKYSSGSRICSSPGSRIQRSQCSKRKKSSAFNMAAVKSYLVPV